MAAALDICANTDQSEAPMNNVLQNIVTRNSSLLHVAAPASASASASALPRKESTCNQQGEA